MRETSRQFCFFAMDNTHADFGFSAPQKHGTNFRSQNVSPLEETSSYNYIRHGVWVSPKCGTTASERRPKCKRLNGTGEKYVCATQCRVTGEHKYVGITPIRNLTTVFTSILNTNVHYISGRSCTSSVVHVRTVGGINDACYCIGATLFFLRVLTWGAQYINQKLVKWKKNKSATW